MQIAVDGGARYVQEFGGFLIGAAQKIAQFHHPDLAFIQRFELTQRFVEDQHLTARRIHPGDIGCRGTR